MFVLYYGKAHNQSHIATAIYIIIILMRNNKYAA